MRGGEGGKKRKFCQKIKNFLFTFSSFSLTYIMTHLKSRRLITSRITSGLSRRTEEAMSEEIIFYFLFALFLLSSRDTPHCDINTWRRAQGESARDINTKRNGKKIQFFFSFFRSLIIICLFD